MITRFPNVRALLFSSIFLLYAFQALQSANHNNGNWIIYDNGSFDFIYDNMSLKSAYPAINGSSIHPLSIDIKRNETGGVIEYSLEEGMIRIVLGGGANIMHIKTELRGFGKAPDRLNPIAGAEIQGADLFYRQGFGFAGASGMYEFPKPDKRIEQAILKEDVWSYDSYLFTGLFKGNTSSMVFLAYDHKNYQHRSSLYNRQNRIGLIDRHLDNNQVFFESGFIMEGIDLCRIDKPHQLLRND